jgi:hypothetical protein
VRLAAATGLKAEGGTIIAIAGFDLGIGVTFEVKPEFYRGEKSAK